LVARTRIISGSSFTGTGSDPPALRHYSVNEKGFSMSIVRVNNDLLTADAQGVQERAILTVKNDSEKLIAEYRKLFGKHVGTDLARELFPDYAKSLENKLKYAVAVQRSAAFIADAVFQRILDESNGGSALFTAGGTGAGKTTAIMRDGTGKRALEGATVIFDGVGSENSGTPIPEILARSAAGGKGSSKFR